MSTSPLVVAGSVGISFGPTRVFDGVDVRIEPGSQTVVTGRSGSGKSTLLLVLAGLLATDHGTVQWPGLAADRRTRRGQIGIVFQAPSLMPELSALENVTLPLRLRGTTVAAARLAATDALAAVEADGLVDARPPQLSGGQQQRVAVARVLAGDHLMVLADEPTGALDRDHARQVIQALRDTVAADGGALVLATHDDEIAASFDERLDLNPRVGAVSR